jgi:deoxyribodipyrimidine photo-lyase
LRRGAVSDEIPRLVAELDAQAVVWSRRYGALRNLDAGLKQTLKASGVEARSVNASLLVEPPAMPRAFKVFTPFWKAAQRLVHVGAAIVAPNLFADPAGLASDAIDSWELHPSSPDWSRGLAAAWTPGEDGAAARLASFLDGPLNGYAAHRNMPGLAGTSRLSPHLRFGEISVAQVWRAVCARVAADSSLESDAAKFCSELGWREFSHHLLYHDVDMPRLSWRRDFDAVPWRTPSADELRAWRRGLTGFPIVDAGMRELWTTGWMHNRVRMIVGSFLTKHLLARWSVGEAWFWDTLVDADEANNAAGWQWIAGTGADAAPYFRIFNPTLQGETYDAAGSYVRTWLPQLSQLPDRWIHRPHEAPPSVLAAAGVELGRTYPRPIVDHACARARALDTIGGVKAAQKESAP